MNAFKILLLAVYCMILYLQASRNSSYNLFQCFSGLQKMQQQHAPSLFKNKSIQVLIILIIFCFIKSFRKSLPIDTQQKKSSSIHRDLSSPPSFFTLLLYIFSLIHSGFQVISGLDDGGSAKASKLCWFSKDMIKYTLAGCRNGWVALWIFSQSNVFRNKKPRVDFIN